MKLVPVLAALALLAYAAPVDLVQEARAEVCDPTEVDTAPEAVRCGRTVVACVVGAVLGVCAAGTLLP